MPLVRANRRKEWRHKVASTKSCDHGAEGGAGLEFEVGEDRDVVAVLGPVGVVADFDASELGGPGFGQEDVVDVKRATLAVIEVMGGAGFGALRLGEKMMIGAGDVFPG